MACENGPLAGLQCRLEDGVEVGSKEVETVIRAPGRHAAAAVTPVVICDHPVVARKIGDLVSPHPEGAGDAVRQHDGIAVFRTEDLGVQQGAVAGPDGLRT